MASATKQALLAALSAAQGECISGQQLAQQLGVSRAAVHKAAAALAAQGYALNPPPYPIPNPTKCRCKFACPASKSGPSR